MFSEIEPHRPIARASNKSGQDNMAPVSLSQISYRRILLKISGEALLGKSTHGIDPEIISLISEEVKSIFKINVQIAIVVGGGNIFRGIQSDNLGIDRATGDYMGMLATIINGLALLNAFEARGMASRLMSAIEIKSVAEPFVLRRALRHLEKERVVIFVAGTGNPFFTTDSAAALRAIEMKADLLLKATKVDGIFTSDPMKDSKATKIKRTTYMDILKADLKIMDAAAISLCRENQIPIRVFNLSNAGALKKIILGEDIGSLVKE